MRQQQLLTTECLSAATAMEHAKFVELFREDARRRGITIRLVLTTIPPPDAAKLRPLPCDWIGMLNRADAAGATEKRRR